MQQSKIYDVAIIGSGPSGLTASIYTSRGSASTIIFGGENWGGQLMLTTEVDNFPSQIGILGPDLMVKMKDHATSFGAKFVSQSVTQIDTTSVPFKLMVNGEWWMAKSIIIATGAETVWLDVPGVKELIGRGISSCAPCDAPFFRNKKVAVVGGGDSAMEEAMVLTKYATEVVVIHRRDTFRASKIMQDKVLNNPKIKVIWNTEVIKASGNGKLESLDLKNNLDGKITNFAVDGLFVAIGHKPMTEIFKGVIDLDEKGFIKVYENSKTNTPGIFVAGDVHDHKYKQAITAAGFGCMAGMDALEYLAS
jgi:thioredoxin reductase (NADPH)